MRKFLGDRFALLTLMQKGAVCAEIGVLHGGFSAAILRHTGPRVLHLVDLWKKQDQEVYDDKANTSDEMQERSYNIVLNRFKKNIAKKQVVVHRGKSSDMIVNLPTLDWVYLDANHSHEAVLEDLLLLTSRVRSDGVIVGHDYCAGDDEGRKFGVIAAVDEFLAAHSGFELVFITNEAWPSYVLASHATAEKLLLAAHGHLSEEKA
jgi:hypothetical protein